MSALISALFGKDSESPISQKVNVIEVTSRIARTCLGRVGPMQVADESIVGSNDGTEGGFDGLIPGGGAICERIAGIDPSPQIARLPPGVGAGILGKRTIDTGMAIIQNFTSQGCSPEAL